MASDGGHRIKLVLLGSYAVGKTCMLHKFVHNACPTFRVTTIAAHYESRPLEVDGKTYDLQLWDTAGQERFDSLTSFYCRGAKGALVCYDVTQYTSLDKADRWCRQLRDQEPGAALVLCATKVDLVVADESKREVSQTDGDALATQLGVQHLQTSARNGLNVEEAFRVLVRTYVRSHPHLHDADGGRDGVPLEPEGTTSKCCPG